MIKIIPAGTRIKFVAKGYFDNNRHLSLGVSGYATVTDPAPASVIRNDIIESCRIKGMATKDGKPFEGTIKLTQFMTCR